MDDISLTVLLGSLIAGGAVLQLLLLRRRHGQSYREHLAPILERHGLSLVSSQFPGWFETGPFPRFEVEVGRPQTRVAGMRGEFDEYRLVIAADSGGNQCTLWALLEFEAFRLRRVRWRAEPKAQAPDSVRPLLEG
jgi:hypothetical protein